MTQRVTVLHSEDIDECGRIYWLCRDPIGIGIFLLIRDMHRSFLARWPPASSPGIPLSVYSGKPGDEAAKEGGREYVVPCWLT